MALNKSWTLLGGLLLLMAPALAGCVSEPQSDGDGDDMPPEPPFSVPALPVPDVDRLIADYKPFVETYSVRKGNHEDHLGARDALAEMFTEIGLDVIRQNYTEGGLDQENIIGIKWGVDRQNWTVVGAHYDTTTTASSHDEQSQGAYDDGSGTMMVVELARAFANVTPYHTIAFVEFDGEERGLRGSDAFYKSVLDESIGYEDIRFHAMLDLDMFGINWPVCAPIYFDQNNVNLRDAVMAYATGDLAIPEDFIKPRGITLGQSDYAHWYSHEDEDGGYHVPTAFFIADFEELALPGVGGQTPAGCAPAAPGAYPFWHHVDTWDTMTQMAGGEENLKAGLDTALKLSAFTLHLMSADPATEL